MRLALAVVLSVFSVVVPAFAQGTGSGLFLNKNSLLPTATAPELTASLVPTGQPDQYAVQVKLVVPPGANTYSQSKEFSRPTDISVAEAAGWKPLGEGFVPDHPPKRSFDDTFQQDLEKFTGTVYFTRLFQAPPGTDPKTAALSGVARFLICDQSQCKPHSVAFKTTFADKPVSPLPTNAAATAPPKAVASASAASDKAFGYEIVPSRKAGQNAQSDPVRLQFELTPKDAQVGQSVTLAITMTLADGWNTYGLKKIDEAQLETPTRIEITTRNLSTVNEFVSDPAPSIHTTRIGNETVRSYAHDNRVTWKQQYVVTAPGAYGLTGKIAYQICREGKCLPPNRVEFSLGEGQAPEHLQGATSVIAPIAPTGKGGGVDEEFIEIPFVQGGTSQTLLGTLGTAFLAGLIMNLLPCVLPVLAIKILSLVQQAGESRARVIGLNLAYTMGVMAVFFALAVMSWGLGKSLSSAFQSSVFMTIMACVVFTMGLSLFGVFELPVPGILPSAHDQHEGYFGAFNTGIIATILGTPCIGPLVSPFFAWTLSQSASVVFLVFGMMGIGMATPYLLTGLFPSLVNWLPKPGMWMVRFKQFTGFVMMGTTIFLLFGMDKSLQVPVLVLLLALALLVWMSANLTNPAEPTWQRYRVYLMSLLTAAPVFWFGLRMMEPEDAPGRMPWTDYSERLVTSLRKEGRPMLIDFTADWCVNCKVNERVALNREETINFVKELGVTPILADYTQESDEIRRRLNQFDQDSVPLTVIIPPGKDSKAIPLRGLYTKRQLLQILRDAVGDLPPQVAQSPEKTLNR
ncbi:cytochrome c biogenesis protein CcdA [Planctomicrobium sp. SH664]|uniref:protein-disulfide reductase DsbD family protein n=1 Tax=Planctomicrobium sp. SH664 TaxID=3448125 RepID=UPI003F5B27FA